MKKYIITDGKRYYRKDHQGKNSFVTNRSLADEMPIKRAKNLLENCITPKERRSLYIESTDEYEINKIVTNDDVRNEIKKINVNAIDFLDQIENTYQQIMQISMFDINDLISMRENLYEALSYYDFAKTDIYHIVKTEKPPAHIRAKIYGIWQEKEIARSNIKEKLRYIDVLIDAYKEDLSITKIQGRLKKAESVPYRARTPVYDEIMTLIEK